MGEEDWQEVPAKAKRGGGGGIGGNSTAGARGGYAGSQPRPASSQSAGSDKRVMVSGLTQSTNERMLAAALKSRGRIDEVTIVREANGASRGFGFVTFGESAAAATAARDGVQIDGKLCSVKIARPRGEEVFRSRATSAAADTAGGESGAGKELIDFVNRHEFSKGLRDVLLSSDQKAAVRVVRQLDATGGYITEPMIYAELAKAARSGLSFELEQRVHDWVQSLPLDVETKDKVQSVLLGQRSEEIEYILDQGRNSAFGSNICKKDNPPVYMMGIIKRYRRDQQQGFVSNFCQRFGFGPETESKLNQLTAEKSRRLLQSWNPASGGSQRQLQQQFLITLEQSLKERQQFEQDRWRRGQQEVSAVASHARIMEDWSNSEEEDDDEETEEAGNQMGASFSQGRCRVSSGLLAWCELALCVCSPAAERHWRGY